MVPEFAPGRTALFRYQLSRPVRSALDDGLLREGLNFFDYGCGRGDDIRLLGEAGFATSGWDPVHQPQAVRTPADVVNFGYVANVIENGAERAAALTEAWALARSVLIVAARTVDEERDLAFREPHGDGVRTSRNTFQKFFTQQELRSWIEAQLDAEAVAAAPGVFYIFRDENQRELYRASRSRRRLNVPTLSLAETRCREHPELVAEIAQFFTARGRLPLPEECASSEAITTVFGSIKRAFAAMRRTGPDEPWDVISAQRREDLILYLALSRFERGSRWSTLPEALQRDVRALCGTYAAASRTAEQLLLEIGRPGAVDAAVAQSTVGKVTPTALYVHRSALGELPLLLRAFEGCGRGYLGEVEGANIVKLYRREAKLSYLSYPDFDRDPHPELAFSLNVDLREFRLKRRRFAGQPNPPILHRKECFVSAHYPRRLTFERLTRSEDAHGLLEQSERIGLKKGWQSVLAEHGLRLQGHRLVRDNQARPSAESKSAT